MGGDARAVQEGHQGKRYCLPRLQIGHGFLRMQGLPPGQVRKKEGGGKLRPVQKISLLLFHHDEHRGPPAQTGQEAAAHRGAQAQPGIHPQERAGVLPERAGEGLEMPAMRLATLLVPGTVPVLREGK